MQSAMNSLAKESAKVLSPNIRLLHNGFSLLGLLLRYAHDHHREDICLRIIQAKRHDTGEDMGLVTIARRLLAVLFDENDERAGELRKRGFNKLHNQDGMNPWLKPRRFERLQKQNRDAAAAQEKEESENNDEDMSDEDDDEDDEPQDEDLWKLNELGLDIIECAEMVMLNIAELAERRSLFRDIFPFLSQGLRDAAKSIDDQPIKPQPENPALRVKHKPGGSLDTADLVVGNGSPDCAPHIFYFTSVCTSVSFRAMQALPVDSMLVEPLDMVRESIELPDGITHQSLLLEKLQIFNGTIMTVTDGAGQLAAPRLIAAILRHALYYENDMGNFLVETAETNEDRGLKTVYTILGALHFLMATVMRDAINRTIVRAAIAYTAEHGGGATASSSSNARVRGRGDDDVNGDDDNSGMQDRSASSIDRDAQVRVALGTAFEHLKTIFSATPDVTSSLWELYVTSSAYNGELVELIKAVLNKAARLHLTTTAADGTFGI